MSRGLRTVDALQLAVALDMLESSWISSSWISMMLSADKRLSEVAEAELGVDAGRPPTPRYPQRREKGMEDLWGLL